MPCVPREKEAADKSGESFTSFRRLPLIGPFCLIPGLVVSCRYVEQNSAAVCIILSYVAKSIVSCFGPSIVRSSVVDMSAPPSSYKPLDLMAATLPELQ
jgi:hypothetical protein